MTALVNIALGLVILGLAFAAIERFAPAIRGQRLLRRGLRTDLIYWFFTPLVTKAISRLAIGIALFVGALALGSSSVREAVIHGHGPVAAWPAWMQALAAFILGDFIGYWMHRLFHGARLWPFHAVHHSSTEVDWLSSVRLHPVNDVVARTAQALPILLLGFPATVLAAYIPLIALYALFLHANVPWSFGPFRYAVASPAFHRWHHTTEREGRDKNFAGFFPIWDICFGTFYLPTDRQPQVFGVPSNAVPDGFLAQILYPFTVRRTR